MCAETDYGSAVPLCLYSVLALQSIQPGDSPVSGSQIRGITIGLSVCVCVCVCVCVSHAGVGVPTERAYHYIQPDDHTSAAANRTDTPTPQNQTQASQSSDRPLGREQDATQRAKKENVTQPFASLGHENMTEDGGDSNPDTEGTYGECGVV